MFGLAVRTNRAKSCHTHVLKIVGCSQEITTQLPVQRLHFRRQSIPRDNPRDKASSSTPTVGLSSVPARHMVGQYIRTLYRTNDSRDQTTFDHTRTMKTQLKSNAASRNSKRSNCEVIKVEIIKVAPDSY
jgi:hypothetical protein